MVSRCAVLATLAFLFAINASSAEAQSTFEVTKTADTNDGVCNVDCSFREALAAANANPGNDVIVHAPTVTGTIILLLGELVVTDDVEIEGPGADVLLIRPSTSSPDHRVMNVGNVIVKVEGLTINGGDTAGRGGGILNSGTLVLENSTVTGNRADLGGGGISGGSLTVVNSTISDNFSIPSGFGSAVGGGIAHFESLSVINSTISGNGAEYGGGIYSQNSIAPLEIVNSTISSNGANEGGGIWLNGGTLTIDASTISGNNADFFGGGILLGGTLTMTNSTLSENTVDPDFGRGGGIFHAGGVATIGNSVFSRNDTNIEGTVTSLGFNISDDDTGPNDVTTDLLNTDPLIGPLADNGGSTLTHALLSGSPAIDIGGTCGPSDQRGFDAPTDGDGVDGIACDAGAVEVPALCDGPPRMAEPVADPVANTVTLTFEDADGITEIEFGLLKNLGVINSDGFTSSDGSLWSASALTPTEAVFVLQQVDPGNPNAQFFVTVADECSAGPEEETYNEDINFDLCPADFDELPSWNGNLTITGGDAPTASAVLSVPGGFKSIELHPDSRNIGLLDVEGLPSPPVGSGSGLFSTGVHSQLFSKLEYGGTSQTAPTEVTAVFGPETRADSRFMFLLTDQNMCTLQVDPVIDFGVPTTVKLDDNYPNPFNPTTSISFSLPEAEDVRLVVYDLTGRMVKTLVSRRMDSGTHQATWDGTTEAGVQAASGVYLYRLDAGSVSQTKQMILLK